MPPSQEVATVASEWLEWESTILAPNLAHVFGAGSKNDKLKSSLISSLDKLNKTLGSSAYLTEVTIIT